MAGFNLPNNPYQTGVTLNSDGPTRLFFQQQASQRAKQETFDEYLGSLEKSVTPAGMRTQDVPGFTNKAKEWTNFGIQKKREIQNPALDGGAALSEFRALHKDLLARTAASKSELEKAKSFAKVANDPELRRRIKPSTITQRGLSDLPTDHADFRPASEIIEFNAKPFDYKEAEDYSKYVIGTIPPKPTLIETIVDPKNPSQKIQRFEYKLDKEGIAARALSAYKSNDSLRDEIIRITDSIMPSKNKYNPDQLDTPKEYHVYNDPFKKFTGRDIESEADVAVAHALLVADQKSIEERVVANDEYNRRMRMQDWQKQEAIRNANSKSNIRLRKSLGVDTRGDEVNINDVYSEISELARGNPYIRPQVLSGQAQGIVMDYAKKAAGDNELASDEVKIVDRGDGQLQLFQTTEGEKEKLLGSLSVKSVNLKAQPSVKEKRAVLSGQKPSSKKSTTFIPRPM